MMCTLPNFVTPILVTPCVLVACDDADETPPCDTGAVDLSDVEVRVEYVVEAGAGKLSVRMFLPGQRFVRLSDGQTLEAFVTEDSVTPAPGATAIGLTETGGEACWAGTYIADLPSAPPRELLVRLSDETFSAAGHVQFASIEVTDAPTRVKVGAPFVVQLDRDVPAVSGWNSGEDWLLELRGDCLVPERDGYAFARDPNGDDSAPQARSEGGKLSFEVRAEQLVAGEGCEVSATFVTLVSHSGRVLTQGAVGWDRFGYYRAKPFVFTLSP
jgi:hypothetical protein